MIPVLSCGALSGGEVVWSACRQAALPRNQALLWLLWSVCVVSPHCHVTDSLRFWGLILHVCCPCNNAARQSDYQKWATIQATSQVRLGQLVSLSIEQASACLEVMNHQEGCGICAVAMWILPESPRWLVVDGRLDEALAVIHVMFTNDRLPAGAGAVPGLRLAALLQVQNGAVVCSRVDVWHTRAHF